jgi:hypothetical protein
MEKYIETPISKKISQTGAKKAVHSNLETVKTRTLLWHVVKRHKFVLVSAYSVVMTVVVFAPYAPGMIFGLVGL